MNMKEIVSIRFFSLSYNLGKSKLELDMWQPIILLNK